MTHHLLDMLIIISALGCGLAAGVFFAFSSFVMTALARLPAAQGVAAMQSINVAAINPAFMGVLFGTALACVAVIAVAVTDWTESRSPWLLAGALLYLASAILVTMLFNVPKNNALARLDPGSAEAAHLWPRYVRGWAAWNHVRTVGALAASAVFVIAAHSG